jgi:lysophospholipase L1-like esterase
VIKSWIAIGDSFTEGVGDYGPDDTCIGWADRLAVQLAEVNPAFSYANLALRGRIMKQILDEQVPVAVAEKPDLFTFCAGGNDIIVPGCDVDDIAAMFDNAVATLRATGAEVLVFTAPDVKFQPVVRMIRTKAAIYNAHIHASADRHGAKVVDLWSMSTLRDRRAWSDDRLHFAPDGHQRIALRTAEVLGLPVTEDWREPLPEVPPLRWLDMRRMDVSWARAHLIPWIGRQLRGESMGDGLTPKRPKLAPYRKSGERKSNERKSKDCSFTA